MKRLSLEEFSSRADRFDAAVMATEGIDVFCSSSDWILPASSALMPPREPWLFEEEGCYWALMRAQHPGGFAYLEPLEAMWALACPVVGANLERLVSGIEALCARPLADWKLLVLAGLPARHPILPILVTRLADKVRLGLGESSARLIANLEDGMSAYLSRRSKSFRRSVHRSQAKAQSAGIEIEDASEGRADELFARIVEVERRSWKGRDAVGIQSGGMHDFYRYMLPRLEQRGAQQVRFATRAGADLAYILGGVRGSTYRGLQFSYDADYGEYALGNVLQLAQMTHCCAHGIFHYDLGMSMDYKRRWSDNEHETIALFVIRD